MQFTAYHSKHLSHRITVAGLGEGAFLKRLSTAPSHRRVAAQDGSGSDRTALSHPHCPPSVPDRVRVISDLPFHASTPTPVRGVNPVTLRSVVGAIRRSEAIDVEYQSLSRLEPRWRWIAHHAVEFDGFRWHTRAFCLSGECFKDYLLSRIVTIRGSRESETSADDGRDWHCVVTLAVSPHPEFVETQTKVIALDYGMRGGKSNIKLRRALLCYALRRLGLDTEPAARSPQDLQIVLLNKEAIDADHR